MRVATIDIGTNSVLLLVAEKTAAGLVPLVERATITRLGQGVDATRRLAPEAVARTLACIEQYATEIRASNVDRVDAVGTSAMRDAEGGESFVAAAKEHLGVAPRVISGEEEARLTFAGALAGLAGDRERAVVVDIGGGSTEIIASGGARAVSLDVGSVRLTERHVRSDPPAAADLDAARADIRAALTAAPAIEGDSAIVGVAGTVTTIAAYALSIAPYDAERVHGATISAADVARARAELAAMPLAARRKLATVSPDRADVIVAGALILEEVLAAFRADRVVVSDRGVRWGLALELVGIGGAA